MNTKGLKVGQTVYIMAAGYISDKNIVSESRIEKISDNNFTLSGISFHPDGSLFLVCTDSLIQYKYGLEYIGYMLWFNKDECDEYAASMMLLDDIYGKLGRLELREMPLDTLNELNALLDKIIKDYPLIN